MRRGQRANAITNSPIVRSFIKPVRSIVPSSSTLPAKPSSALANPYLATIGTLEDKEVADAGEDQREEGPWMIPTQPLTNVAAGRSDVKGKKRARESDVDEERATEFHYDSENGTRFGVQVRYSDADLPKELEKYWAQRYRLFSLYDKGCEMDREGWFSVTPENIAAQIAERCRCGTIIDAFCGVGGNAIQFAFTCEKVIALDISPVRLACARRNAEIYGVADRITFILADWVQWTKDYVQRDQRGEVKDDERIEVVFLSPPWGGIDYQSAGASAAQPPAKKARHSLLAAHIPLPSTPTPALPDPPSTDDASLPPPAYPLSALAPLHGAELFALARKVTHNVAYYLPRNVDLLELACLPQKGPWRGRPLESAQEKVEVEEEWMNWKLKAITAYYGELATGAL
ncbi:hypothetical protein JCM11641_003874 [Rhodosporidiobolus odoratus]